MPVSADDAARAPRYSAGVLFARSAAAIACVLSLASSTAAQEPARSTERDWSVLYDGGALPFFWGGLGVALGFRIFIDPPETPRLFSADEGGEPEVGDTVPEAAVAAYVVAGAGILIAIPAADSVRAFHLKGYGETVMTTAALTEAAKATFGRHRPEWTPERNEDDDLRRAFFSGHASFTFSTSTYLGLYLHGHVFSRWRDPGQGFAWWEILPLGALAAGSVGVALTRLDDNRHHPSDIITGAAVGTTVAVSFYVWQEARYRTFASRLESARASWLERMRILPMLDEPGVHLFATW